RIERMFGQHVYLVNEIHLDTATGRRIAHVVHQFTGFVDAGARGGVNLDQVDKAALVDFTAGAAGSIAYTGLGGAGFGAFAVQTFGDDTPEGGLADTARAGEQQRVVQAIFAQRMA